LGSSFIGLATTLSARIESRGYSTGRKPSRIWQKLPTWLTERVPWASEWRVAASEVTDLRRTQQHYAVVDDNDFAAKTAP
jgi:hypothetical protein